MKIKSTIKGTKRCVIKKNLKFEDYKNYLEATQLENKINHLDKFEIDVWKIVLRKIINNL